jgi:hypothetical protein
MSELSEIKALREQAQRIEDKMEKRLDRIEDKIDARMNRVERDINSFKIRVFFIIGSLTTLAELIKRKMGL